MNRLAGAPTARTIGVPAGVFLLLAGLTACGLDMHPQKRARMATALPSETAAPFAAPFRPSPSSPPALSETETPASVLNCPEQKGALRPETVDSNVLNAAYGFFVYIPPCYNVDSQTRYPALYLFHGLGRTPEEWLSLGLTETADHLIVSGQIEPMLIVLPYVSGDDSNDAAFLADLMPAMDGRYRTQADRLHRAIGGVSRGAEWALRLGLRRADLFASIGLHGLAPSSDGLDEFRAWAEAVPANDWPRLYADAGYDDPFLPQLRGLLQVFDALGKTYEEHIQPGDHSDEYWGRHLADYLMWYAQEWK